MKQHKLLFAVLAMIFATGVLYAFNKPAQKEVKAKTNTIYWFNVDANGDPTTVIGTDPSMVCPEPSGDLCAKAYDESQTTGSGSARTVLELEEENFQDEAFKEEVK
ncbi:DUF6520 family protein [Lacibacter sp.]|uniref:DUF6520 family protein n=1 Tax=Lacibacter sp. TaxID=1915409 RepID=UPI002B4AD5CF|nr:DUF6520 family protein [Lacibacter sp.]HLP37722.1 DUF6520 family protein [Lacibacter sp.]